MTYDSNASARSISVALTPEETLDAVEHAAELWGARWSRLGTGGQLDLPVHAGVRQGVVKGRLSTESHPKGTTLVFHTESSEYALKLGAVAILSLGGLSALALVLWPIYPRLLDVAPLALVFSIVAWLLIASRLQSAGVEDFLNLVATGGEKQRDDARPEAPQD